MKRYWLPLIALWYVGCSGPQSSCSDDSECAADASCNREVGVCVTCDVGSCADYQQCLKGACGARYQSITIKRPTGGLTSPTAPLQAQLDLAPGAIRQDPATLSYNITDAAGKTAASGQMALVKDGLYEGTWTPTGSSNFTLVVTYDQAGLSSAPVQFTIDSQPPTVEIVVPVPTRRTSADPTKADERDPAVSFDTAWRRNEIVNISIKASEPLDLAGSALVLTPQGSGTAIGTPRTLVAAEGCGAPFCATAAIDLAEPAMPAFRLTWGLKLEAKDVAGNAAQTVNTIRVTRQKWRFSVSNDIIQTTPAIGSNGNLFFATSSGTTSVFNLTPNGLPVWGGPAVTGAIRGSMSIQKIGAVEWLFYSASVAGGNVRIFAFNAANGSSTAADCTQAGQDADGSGAIVLVNGVPSYASVVRSSGVTTLVAYRPDQADALARCVTFGTGLRGIDFPGNIAADGADIYFGDDLGNLQSLTLGAGWAVRTGFPANNISPRTIALTESDVTGAVADGIPRGRAFAISKAGAALTNFPGAVSFLPQGWGSSIGPNDQLLFSNQLPAAVLVGVRQAAATKEVTTLPNFRAAPVFGERGLIYIADETGMLSVVDGNLTTQWQVPLANQFLASPTIDCARDNNGAPIAGRPGVLYLASTTGTVDAVIVDSKGLDTTATWPKYQHDPRNTGNSSTSLAEFACP